MDENTGPTPAELVAVVAAMTPKPLKVAEWGAVEGGRAESYHLYHDEKDGAHVASWLSPENAAGFVALHNFFPAMWERYQKMVRALERLACSERFDGIARAALADANKPLTMEPVANFANVARSSIAPSTAQE